jgi:aminoglycoside phosphotransferase (APT) family kinase protein
VIAVDPSNFEEALERLRYEPPARLGVVRPTLTLRRRLRRRFSDVLIVRIDVPGRSFDLFLKRARVDERLETVALVRDNLRREFDGLSRVYATLRHEEGLQAARPVACYPDLETIATERLPGVTLRQLLHRRAVWWAGDAGQRRLERVASAVGRWLGAFQRADRPDRQISPSDLRTYLDDRLLMLVARRWLGISAAQRAALLEYFDERAMRVPTEDLVQSCSHGDFNPENIIVNGDKVGVVDFSMSKPAPRLLDVTHLYIGLDVLRRRPWYRPATLSGTMAALLNAYDPDLQPSQPMFELLALQHGVARLCGLGDRVTPGGATLRGWVLRRMAGQRRSVGPVAIFRKAL